MSTHSEPATDTALPAFDLRGFARRAALPAALAAAAATIVIAAGGPLQTFADAIRRAFEADPRWVAIAAISELLSFGGYVALLWLVGGRATKRLGLRESAQVTLGGAAATRLLPTAGVGGAALTLWALRRTAMGSRKATQTLMTFLITLYSVFLVAIIASGTVLAIEGKGPLPATVVPAAGAAFVLLFHLALAARGPRPDATGRFATAFDMLGEAVREGLRMVRSADPRVLGAIAWWTFDAAVLWATLHAFGAPPSLAVLGLAYFVGQIGNTIPVPGAVSGGMVGILVAFDVPADLALVSVFAYRAVAIWLPAPIGLVALSGLRKTIARWGREDAQVEPIAVVEPIAPPARPLAPARVALPTIPTAGPEPALPLAA
jgi:putative heme transporter